jgi:hypothetical protein
VLSTLHFHGICYSNNMSSLAELLLARGFLRALYTGNIVSPLSL